jgi:hypothetical protein
MKVQLAETTVTVLGRNVTDPALQLVAQIVFVPLFIGIGALVISQRMVDEERLRAEPRVSKYVGGRFVPSRVLTDLGRKVRTGAYVALGIAGVLLLLLILKTR